MHFRTATDLLPDFAQAYSLLGQSLQKLRRVDDAIAAFEHAVRLGEDATGHFGLGLAYRIKGVWPNAVQHFEMAVANDQSFGVAYSYLGTALEKLGKFNEALEAHKKSISIDSKSKYFHFSYAEGLAKFGRTQDAIAAYEASLRIDPGFAPALRRLKAMRVANGLEHRPPASS
jgi:tetratricopeptide (TPR) repeat protein